MMEVQIAEINTIITSYLKEHPEENKIPVKKLMPALIKAGIFVKDEKNGLPIRKLLRTIELDASLEKLPHIYADKNQRNTYWYVVREGVNYVAPENSLISKKQKSIDQRENSDEFFIITLCDQILNESASRKHKFPFLVGDIHKRGKDRSTLAVDAYYKDHNLVVQYEDDPQDFTQTGANFDRAAQIEKYNHKRRIVLEKKDYHFIELKASTFGCNEQHKLIRDVDKIKIILEGKLKKLIGKSN